MIPKEGIDSNMKTIELSFVLYQYPIWIYDDDGDENRDLPKEWENETEFKKLLYEAQMLYDSAYLQQGTDIIFVGFPDQKTMEKMNDLLRRIRDFINKNLPEGWTFKDRVKDGDELCGFDCGYRGMN